MANGAELSSLIRHYLVAIKKSSKIITFSLKASQKKSHIMISKKNSNNMEKLNLSKSLSMVTIPQEDMVSSALKKLSLPPLQ